MQYTRGKQHPPQWVPPTNRRAVGTLNYNIILWLHHYLCKNYTVWDTYLLTLAYAYKLQVHRSIKSGPAAVAPKRVSLTLDDDTALPVYAVPEKIRKDKGIRQENEEIKNWDKDKTRRSTNDTSVLLQSVQFEKTVIWTDSLSSARLQNIPAQRDKYASATQARALQGGWCKW